MLDLEMLDLEILNQMILQNRRDYGDRYTLSENTAAIDPFVQFSLWFEETLRCVAPEQDPCAMVLATDDHHQPDTRMVLLLGLAHNRFIFYTHYESQKAKQIEANDRAAINFYWPTFARQIRIKGLVHKTSKKENEILFTSRPRDSQLSVYAWRQDEVLKDRNEMHQRLKQVTREFENKTIPCPDNWGGYQLEGEEYEFFQGRQGRQHDRLLYQLKDKMWVKTRLAP